MQYVCDGSESRRIVTSVRYFLIIIDSMELDRLTAIPDQHRRSAASTGSNLYLINLAIRKGQTLVLRSRDAREMIT